MSVQPLFTPVRMGDLDLPNRIVMAPLTRMRAGSIDHVPTALQAEYYAQRASAGPIVAEATAISPEGFGWADTPDYGVQNRCGDGAKSPTPCMPPVAASSHSFGTPALSPIPTCAAVRSHCRHPTSTLFASPSRFQDESLRSRRDRWQSRRSAKPLPNMHAQQRNGGGIRRIGDTRRLSLPDPPIRPS
jgi:hypothetical protein